MTTIEIREIGNGYIAKVKGGKMSIPHQYQQVVPFPHLIHVSAEKEYFAATVDELLELIRDKAFGDQK